MRATLRALYASYRAREHMTGKVLRDRGALPALDALMKQTFDAQLTRLADALAGGFRARGGRARRLRAVVVLALDFWTWQRLAGEGIADTAAADLMAHLVAAAACEERSATSRHA